MVAPTGQTHDLHPTAIVAIANQHLTQGRPPHMTGLGTSTVHKLKRQIEAE
jgi:hypothetical protein